MELLFWIAIGCFGVYMLIAGIVGSCLVKIREELADLKTREVMLAERISWLEEKYIDALDDRMAEERFEWDFTEEEINKALGDDEEEVIDEELPAFENKPVDIVDLMLGDEEEEKDGVEK